MHGSVMVDPLYHCPSACFASHAVARSKIGRERLDTASYRTTYSQLSYHGQLGPREPLQSVAPTKSAHSFFSFILSDDHMRFIMSPIHFLIRSFGCFLGVFVRVSRSHTKLLLLLWRHSRLLSFYITIAIVEVTQKLFHIPRGCPLVALIGGTKNMF